MKIVERFEPMLGTGWNEATLQNDEDSVLAICQYTVKPDCVYVSWLNANERRKGWATALLHHLEDKHKKPIVPGVILPTPEAEGFWAFFLFGAKHE